MGFLAQARFSHFRNREHSDQQFDWMFDSLRSPSKWCIRRVYRINNTDRLLQGFPVCVALSLIIIAKRMGKRNVLIKNLAAIETLGCMSVLCSDKNVRLQWDRWCVTLH
jgi:hypothetical protein